MDRPSQEPPERADPPPAADSPLRFPVEASRPAADSPLSFPVEAPRPTDLNPPPAAAPFPAEADRLPDAAPLPFPVAELPGLPAGPPQAVQPQQAPQPQTATTTPAPPAFLRFVPPLLTLLAAFLTIGGLLQPLFRIQEHVSVRQRLFEAQVTITQTAWGTRIEAPGQDAALRPGTPLGVPLIIAAILLVVAAVTALSRPRREAGRWLVGASAVFTAGVVLTVGMGRFELSAIVDANDLDVVTGAGMWLLILATVVAAVAAVLVHLPFRKPGWADPEAAYADTPTPPSGIAITVLPPDDEERP